MKRKFKYFFGFILIFVFVLAGCTNGETTYLDYTISNNQATIHSYTYDPDTSSKKAPESFDMPTKIKGKPVVAVDTNAFTGHAHIKKVNITDLSGWCKIDFSNDAANPLYYGADLFINNKKLVDLTIPDDVTEIGDYAFFGYQCLQSVTIPSHVTSIGKHAFRSCHNLKSVHITDLSAWMNISFGDYASNPLYSGADLYLNGNKITNLSIPSNISQIKDNAFAGFSSLSSVSFSSNINSIGNYAFHDCLNLTNITIPASVSTIGDNAFSGCDNLESVFFQPNSSLTTLGSHAFAWCEKLANINLDQANYLSVIGRYAFENCIFESITIPKSVTIIGDHAFYNCQSLKKVYITDIAAWCNIDFEVVEHPLPSHPYSHPLCYDAVLYLNGTKLTNLTIPSDVTKINNYTFYNSHLETVFVPASVKTIGNGSFKDCSGITNIEFEEGSQLESIGKRAFEICNNLYEIKIPSGVKTIGEDAFSTCHNIAAVYIEDLTAWMNIDFENYDSNPLANIAKLYVNYLPLTNLVIPDNVDQIKDYTFYGCNSITKVTIPSTVTIIGQSSFSWCVNISELIFEKNSQLTTIKSQAFDTCPALTTVKLPASITTMGDYIFSGFGMQLKVYCEATSEQPGWHINWKAGLNAPYYHPYYYSEQKPTSPGKWWHYVDGVVTEWT